MRRTSSAAIALCALLFGNTASAGATESQNIEVVKRFPYEGGTDIDFFGDFAYAGSEGNEGGIRIFDVARKVPQQVAFVACPGSQNDVAMASKRLLALAYHSGGCGAKPGAGVQLIDVGNPKRPRYLGQVELPGGTHTLTKYPGKPIIYASPGGLLNGRGIEQILDISDPRKIEVAATYTPNPAGCHDITFFFKKDTKLAFCPGLSGTDIWDVSDPLKPKTISHITWPVQDFHHLAVPTPDGKYLVISDENFEAHDCTSGQSPTGAMYVWDISSPATPVLAGKFSPQRGAAAVGGVATPVCTSHNMNFIPGTRLLVSSWYTMGTSVIDFSNPSSPEEVAFYQPDDVDTWSSYWYRGRIYANDLARGFEILELDGVKIPRGRA